MTRVSSPVNSAAGALTGASATIAAVEKSTVEPARFNILDLLLAKQFNDFGRYVIMMSKSCPMTNVNNKILSNSPSREPGLR
jgi:hypothetical protein